MSKRTILSSGALALPLAALLAAPAAANDDGAIREAAARAVLSYPYYTVFDGVGVAVQDGSVTLVGSVKEPYRKTDLEKRVAAVPGVREVKSEIRVQPVSIFDDRLRYELYRRIYGSSLFSNYAGWVDPPIRILVENGRVTLAGTVLSEVERVAVGAIARGSLAFGVDNQVRLERDAVRPAPVKSVS